MLTKTQSKILKSAVKLSNDGTAVISWYEISRDLDIHPAIVFKAVKILVNKELLEYVYDTEKHIPQGFILTSYSINLKEYNRLQIKMFLLNNLIAILALILSIISLVLSLANNNNQINNYHAENIYLESFPISTPNEIPHT